MKIKPNFADNTTVFRPKFRVESPVPTFKPETENPSLKIKTENSLPANFGEVYVVKENVEPAYGKVQIGDIIYDSLDSALEAVKSGDTIILQSDIICKTPLSFTTDFCLDLNGYTLTAEGVALLAKGGSIVDNGATKGLLVVPKGFLVMNHAVYGMLPVWNEEGTGYIFVKVTDQFKPVEIIEDGFVVEFRPSIAGGGVVSKDVFSDGALDNEIAFKVNIVGYDESGNIVQTIALPPIDEELISRVYTNSTSFKFTVSGISRYARTAVELAIETEAGLVYSSEMGSVEN